MTAWQMTESEVFVDEPAYEWTRWINPEGTVFELLEVDWVGGMLGNHCYPGVAVWVGCGINTPVHYGQAALEFYVAHPRMNSGVTSRLWIAAPQREVLGGMRLVGPSIKARRSDQSPSGWIG